MKKKFDVRQLSIGMYVSELDRPWLETPFIFQGFEIRSQEEIAQLRRYCKFVYINLPDNYSVSPAPRRPPTVRPVEAKTPQKFDESQIKFEQDALKLINRPSGRPHYDDKTTLESEIEAVGEHYQSAKNQISTIMEDARLRRSIDAPGAKQAVATLAESVIRNPDALTCFIQLRKHDEYTAQHSLRVCILALVFGRHLGFEPEELKILGIGGLLHDIGKMKVPIDILNKPGRLNPKEFAIMQTHVPRGVVILEHTRNIPAAAIDVARCHHERHDGNGYSIGLKGEQIGLFGMIGGIVDCYDAVTSDRVYQPGMSTHSALKQMYDWRIKDFHPQLVEQFIRCMGIYPIGSIVELNTGEVGVVVTMNRLRRLKPRVTLVLQPNRQPYLERQIVDLFHEKIAEDRPYEIERVLEPGSYGVDPAKYLPISQSFFAGA